MPCDIDASWGPCSRGRLAAGHGPVRSRPPCSRATATALRTIDNATPSRFSSSGPSPRPPVAPPKWPMGNRAPDPGKPPSTGNRVRPRSLPRVTSRRARRLRCNRTGHSRYPTATKQPASPRDRSPRDRRAEARPAAIPPRRACRSRFPAADPLRRASCCGYAGSAPRNSRRPRVPCSHTREDISHPCHRLTAERSPPTAQTRFRCLTSMEAWPAVRIPAARRQ